MSIELKLNLADRNLIAVMLHTYSGLNDMDMDATVHMADLTKALDLDEAQDVVDGLNLDCRRAYVKAARVTERAREAIRQWEEENPEKVSPDALIDKLYLAEDSERNTPQAASYRLLMETDLLEFSIEKSDFDWLLKIFNDYRWNSRLSRTPQGTFDAVRMPLNKEEALAISALRDKLKVAAI